jgi:uncharacterized phosphosugar-binding protein
MMPKNALAQKYFSIVADTLESILNDESDAIYKAAKQMAESVKLHNILHVFGTGHSHVFAEEVARRAGGLVCINPILDIGYTLMGGFPARPTRLERLEGYSKLLLENHELNAGETIVIVSQSGINTGPVEAALYCKEMGLNVIAISSVSQSKKTPSRHSSGLRLFEIAHITIDNHVPDGDATLEINPLTARISPLSTVVGSAILQALVAETIGILLTEGIIPPIWSSANLPDGDNKNKLVGEAYPNRVKTMLR